MDWKTVLVAAPFVLFTVLLFWGKMKLLQISLIALIFTTAIALFYWKMYPVYLIGSLEKGFFVALDIFFIIFGAIFFLEILKKAQVIENIGYYLETISGDLRVQVILLAWFFENFLEGTAGFGTPATVVAPLLVGLGVTPLNAVIISLLGNSSAGVFGAAGTPIKVGFGDLAGAGVPFKASVINLVGVLIPVFVLLFLNKSREGGKKGFFGALPFAVWSGIAFLVPSILLVPLGQEFPSILGSVAGIILVLLTVKIGFFVPKTNPVFVSKTRNRANLPLKKVVFPYIFLIILLLVGKFALGQNGLPIPIVIKHTFAFFNPGFAFVVAGAITAVAFKIPIKTLFISSGPAVNKAVGPFLVIAFMSSIAQIMVYSNQNYTGFISMINILASSVRNALLPIWAPFIGALGSFLTGSITVSNLMFGNFLATAANDLNFNVDNILALALVGGAVGNMIALADVLVAETVVGLKHKESGIIKIVIWPCLISVVLIGLMGMLFF